MPLDSEGWYVYEPDGGKVKLEVDLGAGWVNVTGWWAGLQRVSGRAGPLDRFNASTLTFQLDNRNREWSPWRTGPYGKPERNQPVRFRAQTPGGLIVHRFTGWTSRWEEIALVGVQGTAVSRVMVDCVDGFRRLARANGIATTPAGAGELSGARIHRILDAAGWPEDLRRIDDGEVTLAATDLSRSALDEMQDVALAEAGVLLIDPEGYVVFFDRATMTGSLDPAAVLGGSVPTGDLRFGVNDDALVNTVRVARTGGTAYTAVDTGSVTTDGPRLWSRTDLPLELDTDAEALAPVLLARAVNSTFMPGPVILRPISGGAPVWDAVVRLQCTNPISLAYFDQELAAGFTALTRIDGITDDIQPGRWQTTYTHSPLDQPGDYTVVGPPTSLSCSSGTTTISWTWTIPGHGYDRLWIRVDSGAWFEIPNTATGFTASGLMPSTSHTLCIRGRLDLVDTSEVCATCTTLAAPGPPGSGDEDGDPGGSVDVPDPDEGCMGEGTWVWTLYELDYVDGVTEIDTGTLSAVLDDWVPPGFVPVPTTWYRMCWQHQCGGVDDGDPTCWDWQEPADWADACDWPDPTSPTPDPVFWVELCPPTRELRELVSDSLMFTGELFGGPTPDPNGNPAILVGPGFDPAKVGSGYYSQIGVLGTSPGPTFAKMTVGMWVNFDSEPSHVFPLTRVGTIGDDFVAWGIYARGSPLSVGKVKIGLSWATPDATYHAVDWDTTGETDCVEIAGWHTIVVTFGDHGVDGYLARLYLDAVQVGEVELPATWIVHPHDNLLEWQGEPNSKTAHLMGWDVILTAAEIEDIFTPPTVAPPTLEEEILADGPVHYWKLNETAGTVIEDYGTPTDVDGTVPSAPNNPTLNSIALPAEIGGNAPDFVLDANPDRIDLGDDNSLTFTGDLSIEAMIRPDAVVTGTSQTVLSKANSQTASAAEWALQLLAAGYPQFTIFNTSSANWKAIELRNPRMVDATWHHLYVSYNNTSGVLAVWVNGTKWKTLTPTAAGTRQGNSATVGYIGAQSGTTPPRFYWNGALAHVAMYDKVLADARVEAHFDATGLTATPDASGLAAEMLADSPVTFHRLIETTGTVALDEGRADMPGVYTGGVTLNSIALPSGPGGNAPDFDGTNDYVTLGGDASDGVPTPNFTGSFTIECLMRTDSTAAGSRMIVSKANQAAAGGGWQLYMNAGNVLFDVLNSTSGTYKNQTVTGGWSTATWYHLVARYDDSTGAVAIFRNGTKTESTPAGSGTRDNVTTQPMYIGAVGGSGGTSSPRFFHNGALAYAATYDTALSDARIAAHFAATGL